MSLTIIQYMHVNTWANFKWNKFNVRPCELTFSLFNNKAIESVLHKTQKAINAKSKKTIQYKKDTYK